MKGKAQINKGLVKKTNGQIKRHVSTMDQTDVSRIKANIRMIPNLYLGRHVYDKVERQGLDFSAVMITEVLAHVKKRNIIEYNITPTKRGMDRRVLLRSDEIYPVELANNSEVDSNLCFVLSLDTGKVVTVYWNKVQDIHKTLDNRRYSMDLQII